MSPQNILQVNLTRRATMDTLLLKIRDMILATRQQWIGEITYNHNIKGV
ncbi:hypothetical protein VCRA2119O48_140001 [Vibrio crassostreae]|nr:hypothetical protein VCRA2119O48_140001 [Vibrio crassostreae]CAK3781982.1 hypothetical protein VCRA212O16_140115 [Vibrio crassostreae]